MLPFLVPVLASLASSGLTTLVEAVKTTGVQVVEDKLGIKLPTSVNQLTPELLQKLKEKEMEHEEFLVDAQKEVIIANIEADKVASQGVTKRWEADMLSDSWLSKNIRPLALVILTSTMIIFAVMSAFGVSVGGEYASLLGDLLKTVFGAYFIGRTVEKSIDIYNGWKQTGGN